MSKTGFETTERLDHDSLLRRGLLLEYITLGWNVVGTGIVLFEAIRAHSVALAAFGLDSVIEIGASTVVVWQLKDVGKSRERPALRFISVAFFALAAYIAIQSLHSLLVRTVSATSPLGIAWLALTFVAMMTLAYGKGRTGAKLGNQVLETEARVTRVDAYLAASVLLGLILNATLHLWWADPIAALVVVFYGVKEGLHAWKESTAV